MPATAEAIPANVLANPFIGEARRFDGAVAPSGWMLARGQTLSVTQNPLLYSILAKTGRSDTTSFKLPDAPYGLIVAVAGMYPTSPAMLAQSGRRMTALDSLGPSAQPGKPRPIKPMSPALLAQRKLITSGVRVGRSSPVAVPAELSERFHSARTDARAAAIAQLSPANQARLDAAVHSAVAGRTSVYGAVTEMIRSLTNGEADALLRVNAGMIQAFNPSATEPSRNAVDDAAHFLISVAFTREQVRTMNARERSMGR